MTMLPVEQSRELLLVPQTFTVEEQSLPVGLWGWFRVSCGGERGAGGGFAVLYSRCFSRCLWSSAILRAPVCTRASLDAGKGLRLPKERRCPARRWKGGRRLVPPRVPGSCERPRSPAAPGEPYAALSRQLLGSFRVRCCARRPPRAGRAAKPQPFDKA